MRDPSIHIRRSDLVRVMRQLGMSVDKVDILFKLCKTYRVKGRYLVKDKPISDNTGRFLAALKAIRMKQRHKGVTPIARGSKAWKQAENIAIKVDAFANDFDLSYDFAAKYYIEQALNRMRVFRMNSISRYHEDIIAQYEIENSDNKGAVELMEYYLKKADLTKFQKDFKEPKVFVNFIKAYEECAGDIQGWVDAQFKGIEWSGDLPQPNQLHGSGAQLRFKNYKDGKKKPKTEKISELIEARRKNRASKG